MFCTRILVAFDESELALKSLEKAIEIAKTNPNIEVELLHSVLWPINFNKNRKNLEDSLLENGRKVIAKAEARLAELPNITRSYVLVGTPTRAILDHASAHDCDLIIMGSRGLSGIKELLGSVSHYVVQNSTIPVLVIK